MSGVWGGGDIVINDDTKFWQQKADRCLYSPPDDYLLINWIPLSGLIAISEQAYY